MILTRLSRLAALLACCCPLVLNAALNTNRIEELTGLKGTLNEDEGVFKVSAPRTDIPIVVDGWTMPPFMGLTSWAAFKEGMKAEAMVAGDLVLFEDEVNPVMSVLLDAGVSVTALHNHFFFDRPRVYFMHIGGEGTVQQLGSALKAALEAQKRIRQERILHGAPLESSSLVKSSSTRPRRDSRVSSPG
jgi:hypothetical protein